MCVPLASKKGPSALMRPSSPTESCSCGASQGEDEG